MKTFFRNLFLGSGLAFALSACAPDHVQPNNSSSPATELQAQDVAHPLLSPICTGIEPAQLVLSNGSSQVNHCGFLPCGPEAPEWGTVEIMDGLDENGEHVMAINFALEFGWFIKGISYTIAPQGSIEMDPQQLPVLRNSWYYQDVNPLVNATQLRHKLSEIGDAMGTNGCFDIALQLDIVRLSFFGGEEPGTGRKVWMSYDNGGTSNLVTTWCPNNCGATGASIEPAAPAYACETAPPMPSWNCSLTQDNNININNANDVVCASGNQNSIGGVNFNQAGTLVIPAGVSISGGINANNGGTLIVLGEFNWNQNANINGNFEIYVGKDGRLVRQNDLTMNNQNNLLVNYGEVEIKQNLTYSGKVYNNGRLNARGLNVNSNSQFTNGGRAEFAQFANLNNGTFNENCGFLRVGNNLQVNSGADFINGCTVIAENFSHQNGHLDNYGIYIAGLSGWGDGFSNQGESVFHDGSVIVTKNFYWSQNRPIELDGEATVCIAESGLDSDYNLTGFQGRGQLRFSQSCQLQGAGILNVYDIDPLGQGDNPTGGHLSFPESFQSMINLSGATAVNFKALNPSADLPVICGR